MSQNPSQEDSDTSSAQSALFSLPVPVNDGSQFASVKCSECKSVTPHEWVKISPRSTFAVDPMEILKLTKRLTLCTICGTLKVIN